MRGEEPPETVDPLLSEIRQLREVYEAILDALRAADGRFAAVEQQIAPSTGLVIDGGGPRPDRKSTRLNSSHSQQSRMPSSA